MSATAWLVILSRHYSLNLTQVHHHSVAYSAPTDFAAEMFDWFTMVIAMMLPVVIGGVRYAAGRSLWHRRHRAIGLFLMGYVAPWMIAGGIASVAIAGFDLREWNHGTFITAGSFAVAAIWQLTGFKSQALWSCHRTIPLAPYGSYADRDCLRYGWTVGVPCLVSCGPVMMACMLAGHGLLAMTFASAISFAERRQLRPNHRFFAGALTGFAIFQAVL